MARAGRLHQRAAALPLLGFAGVLQYFSADFRAAQEEVELTVNSLYPGS
jgi:hypothetical protein